MKKILLIAIALVSTISCNKNIATQESKKDSTVYIETVKLDTIYLQMKADTTYIKVAADCPDQETILKDGKKEVKVIIKDKILYVTQITKADSIAIVNAFKNSKEYASKELVKIVKETVFKTPKWAKDLMLAESILIVIALIYLLFRFRSKLAKIVKGF